MLLQCRKCHSYNSMTVVAHCFFFKKSHLWCYLQNRFIKMELLSQGCSQFRHWWTMPQNYPVLRHVSPANTGILPTYNTFQRWYLNFSFFFFQGRIQSSLVHCLQLLYLFILHNNSVREALKRLLYRWGKREGREGTCPPRGEAKVPSCVSDSQTRLFSPSLHLAPLGLLVPRRFYSQSLAALAHVSHGPRRRLRPRYSADEASLSSSSSRSPAPHPYLCCSLSP